MSGKYIVSESSSVIRAIETNLQHSQRVADTLKRATNQLTSALQSGDLKGRTYGSAKNYVLNVLNPLMNKASEGISDGLLDLATYKYEDGQIAHYGNIDVEQLKEEKQIKEEARRKVESQRERLQNLPLSALAVASPVAYAGALGAMVSFEQNMNDSIKKIDEKLLAYETFNSNTNGLFGDANALFENLENALNALSGIKISGSGSNLRLSIPSNVEGLVSKTTSSKLTAGDSDSSYGSIQSMAEELGISQAKAENLCDEYNVSPNDNIIFSFLDDGSVSVINKTTGKDLTQANFSRYFDFINEFNGVNQVSQNSPIDAIPRQEDKDHWNEYLNDHRTQIKDSGGMPGYAKDTLVTGGLSVFDALLQWMKTTGVNGDNNKFTGVEYIIYQEYLKENAEKIRAQEDAIKVAQNPGNNWSQNNGIGLGGGIYTD